MSDDNLGNFFYADNFNDDGEDRNSENWKPIKIYGHQLLKKGIEILNITQTICDVLPEDEQADITKRLMLENATLVPPKIMGALAVDQIYSLVMESAVIIKVNICELKAQLWACRAIHHVEEKYLDVLKNEMKEFRMIFIQWITSLDKEVDLPDAWHLFNDPATFPENFDPEDE